MLLHECSCFIEFIKRVGEEITLVLLHECSCFIEFIKPVGEEIKCKACQGFYLFFRNESNKFINTRA